MYKINHQNIKEWIKQDTELFDGVLCDPPYELGFMGKSWDSSGIAFDVDMWKGIYDKLKPGAHLLAFSGSRTYHRMAVAIEDAGFEIRDQIIWMYGSGFPKSLNIGKAVDKLGGRCLGMEVAELIKKRRIELGYSTIKLAELGKFYGNTNHGGTVSNWETGTGSITPEQFNKLIEILGLEDDPIVESERKLIGIKNANEFAYSPGLEKALEKTTLDITKGTSEWEGYGTALKPAHEPCVLARKPIEGTVANNVLTHGTGGLNIDGTRVGTQESLARPFGNAGIGVQQLSNIPKGTVTGEGATGRFPANLIHDGSDEVEAVFPQTKSGKGKKAGVANSSSIFAGAGRTGNDDYGDSGSASRYFYCAKASKKERNAGLEGFEEKITNDGREKDIDNAFQRGTTLRSNHHPTVKPLSLTKYLATLIKPPTGGRLLVPFSGSGSEMIGALQAGWEYVEGVELTEEYIPIAEARIKYWLEKEKTKQETLL